MSGHRVCHLAATMYDTINRPFREASPPRYQESIPAVAPGVSADPQMK